MKDVRESCSKSAAELKGEDEVFWIFEIMPWLLGCELIFIETVSHAKFTWSIKWKGFIIPQNFLLIPLQIVSPSLCGNCCPDEVFQIPCCLFQLWSTRNVILIIRPVVHFNFKFRVSCASTYNPVGFLQIYKDKLFAIDLTTSSQ